MRRAMFFMLMIAMILSVSADEDAPPNLGEWTTGEPMPTARSEITAAHLDGRIYVAGGLGAGGESLTAFEVYDLEEETWSELEPLPEGLHHTAMAAADGRLYVTGGYTDLSFRPANPRVWVYDPAAGQWSQAADMPQPRGAHAMVSIDDRLYVVGGVGPESRQIMIYDPEADTWEISESRMPTIREHLAVVALDGQTYVLAGRRSGEGNLTVVERYDPETDTWESLAPMENARSGFAAGVLGGYIHVTGGESLSGGETFASHEVYDPEADTWFNLPDMPTSRHGITSVSVENRWYVIGGATQAGGGTTRSLEDLVEIYTPEQIAEEDS